MYAIVKIGGKQYRVEKGDSLVVDRMPEKEGAKVALEPLLYRSDKAVFDGAELAKVKVDAVVTGHERGEKLHVLKFKPKKGYKVRSGHRSDLTRLEIKDIKLGAARSGGAAKPAAKADTKAPAKPATKKPAAKPATKAAAKKPAPKKPAAKKPAARKPAAKPKKKEADDGS